MKRGVTFLPIFIFFFIVSIITVYLSQQGLLKGVAGFFEQATVPVQRLTFGIFHPAGNQSTEENFREENQKVLTQLARQQEIEKENKALHDQFATTNPSPKELLPVTIIGISDEQIRIDKGESDGIKPGAIIVYKDNVVGKVVKTAKHLSIANLITHTNTSFTAQTTKTSAVGVLVGENGNLTLNNVVLSEKLEKDALVVTKGDIDNNSHGYPPDLVVGKIVSVNKQASALFQQAEIRSLIDFSKLHTVFVLL